jgi:D-alanine-D-alanine ligase
MRKSSLNVVVCFGGPSVEHDVSIISAAQLMAALGDRHEVTPVYLGRDGRYWTGDALRDVGAFVSDPPADAVPCELRLGAPSMPFVAPRTSRFRSETPIRADAAICAIHGTGGEDGALLGALELAGVPYAGGGVAASAVAMDKAFGKSVYDAAGIDVVPHRLLTRSGFAAEPEAVVAECGDAIGYPCYAKPNSLGSSIGVARCESAEELRAALELCFELDRRALVEPALDDALELNVAVLGREDDLRTSVVEQPVRVSGSALSFEDKYLRGAKAGADGASNSAAKPAGAPIRAAAGAPGRGKGGGGMAAQDRIIPADIPDPLAERIADAARQAHRALGFAGVARYDFLVEDASGGQPRVVLNEANTVPGSFAFYLFEPMGTTFAELADALLDIALAEAAERRATTRTFASTLLTLHAGAPRS